MRRMISALLLSLVAAAPQGGLDVGGELPRVLFLTHSAGFTHGVVKRERPDALAHAERALVEMARGVFEVEATQDCAAISAESLAGFDAVVFYTTGELPVDAAGRAALFEWVRRGGAFVGVHCATDTWYEEPRYMELVGGADQRGLRVRLDGGLVLAPQL